MIAPDGKTLLLLGQVTLVEIANEHTFQFILLSRPERRTTDLMPPESHGPPRWLISCVLLIDHGICGRAVVHRPDR